MYRKRFGIVYAVLGCTFATAACVGTAPEGLGENSSAAIGTKTLALPAIGKIFKRASDDTYSYTGTGTLITPVAVFTGAHVLDYMTSETSFTSDWPDPPLFYFVVETKRRVFAVPLVSMISYTTSGNAEGWPLRSDWDQAVAFTAMRLPPEHVSPISAVDGRLRFPDDVPDKVSFYGYGDQTNDPLMRGVASGTKRVIEFSKDELLKALTPPESDDPCGGNQKVTWPGDSGGAWIGAAMNLPGALIGTHVGSYDNVLSVVWSPLFERPFIQQFANDVSGHAALTLTPPVLEQAMGVRSGNESDRAQNHNFYLGVSVVERDSLENFEERALLRFTFNGLPHSTVTAARLKLTVRPNKHPEVMLAIAALPDDFDWDPTTVTWNELARHLPTQGQVRELGRVTVAANQPGQSQSIDVAITEYVNEQLAKSEPHRRVSLMVYSVQGAAKTSDERIQIKGPSADLGGNSMWGPLDGPKIVLEGVQTR